MSITASEIESAALAALSSFPTVATFVQAGDPRVLAQIRAQAAMLAMMSEQVDVAQYEPFVKARDSTVLADASLKGILPLARACRVSLSVTNGDAAPFMLAAGRRLMDQKGRIYVVESAVTITAGATVTVACSQRTTRTIAHSVAVATPFYRIELEQSESDVYLNTIGVFLGAQEFAYAPDWFNVDTGTFAYQAETDERRKLWICFGAQDVIGYGVQPGDSFELRVTECEGLITDLAPASAFSLEYVYTPADGLLGAVLSSVLDTGAAPPSMADLRVMSRYPSIYDHNAVYLGEFDFLLRRYLTGIRFLSVWNEQIEEAARGASVNNINRLFVSGLVTGMTDSAFQARALELISRADDSYKVVFVNTSVLPVAVSITCTVAVVHDTATVESQIRAAMLEKYGDGMPDVSKGMSNPIRYQVINRLLREKVPALQDELSDFKVTVTLPGTVLPEQFLHISAGSLTVTVDRADYNSGLWNY
nr:hypothetical protein [uncultured Rhodoferax sp.]